MNPKDGEAGKAVAPAEPDQAEDADLADPGKMREIKADQIKNKEGKYGSEQVKPHQPDEEKTSWIEIEMVDEEDEPVPGEQYRITLPDDTVAQGTLDENGFARIEGIDPGNCKIAFSMLYECSWETT